MSILIALAMFVTSGAAVAASSTGMGSLQEFAINVGEQERWTSVYAPPQYQQGAPLVLLLHGGTQSMRKLFNRGGAKHWLTLAEREKFLLLVPNGTNAQTADPKGDKQNWNDYRSGQAEGQTNADDVGFILALLDWAEAKYQYDRQRVYVTGASNGGMMTMRLLVEHPERFTAAAAFIASLPAQPPPKPKAQARVPLMLLNGTRDPLVRWQGGAVHKDRGETMAIESMLQWWLQVNGVADGKPTAETLSDLDPSDDCRITRKTWVAQADGGASVVFYKVDGGGHSLPSVAHPLNAGLFLRSIIGPQCRDAEGAELAWQFFRTNTRH